MALVSGTWTHLKVGGAPIRRESGGARDFLVMPPHFFGSKSTISRFESAFDAFRDGQYSLVSFLFAVLLLTVPCPDSTAQPSGGSCPPVPYGVGTTCFSVDYRRGRYRPITSNLLQAEKLTLFFRRHPSTDFANWKLSSFPNGSFCCQHFSGHCISSLDYLHIDDWLIVWLISQ